MPILRRRNPFTPEEWEKKSCLIFNGEDEGESEVEESDGIVGEGEFIIIE